MANKKKQQQKKKQAKAAAAAAATENGDAGSECVAMSYLYIGY